MSTEDFAEAQGFALAFPGQGIKVDALREALLRHWSHPLVESLRAHFGIEDPEEGFDFGNTSHAQPAIYATGLAQAEEYLGSLAGGRPTVVLGHSLGELAAAAAAGIIDPEEGLHLAVRRGELTQARDTSRPGTMAAIMGTDLAGVEWLRRRAIGRSPGVLEIAGMNGSRQTVVSGDVETVREAVRIAGGDGLLAEILPIRGGFHSPLMLGSVPLWREAVAAVDFRPGHTAFVSAVTAEVVTAPEDVRELLVRALLMPVRWIDAVRTTRREGVHHIMDAGPGTTLHKLGRREKIVHFTPLARQDMTEGTPT